MWTNIKVVCPKLKWYFQKKKKKNFKHEILSHLYFGPNFAFQGTAITKFFFVSQPWWLTFLLSTRHHKKASNSNVRTRMFYFTRSNTSVFSIALTLLLIYSFLIPNSHKYHIWFKRDVQLKFQSFLWHSEKSHHDYINF